MLGQWSLLSISSWSSKHHIDQVSMQPQHFVFSRGVLSHESDMSVLVMPEQVHVGVELQGAVIQVCETDVLSVNVLDVRLVCLLFLVPHTVNGWISIILAPTTAMALGPLLVPSWVLMSSDLLLGGPVFDSAAFLAHGLELVSVHHLNYI